MALARFDLKIGHEEKEAVSHAAALTGTTMAAFMRVAVTEKAREIIDRESRVRMTARDFQAFIAALDTLEEQLLDVHKHDRKAFTSGVQALDDYLQRHAVQQEKKVSALYGC